MAVVNFCYDRLGPTPRLGYPNLALPGLDPDQFDDTPPRVLPLRLLTYLDSAGMKFQSHLAETAPNGSWYPVALAWFDFSLDYFALMCDVVKNRIRNGELKVLFYYHEGDNPARIKQRLDTCVVNHSLPKNCYLFVSANSSARYLEHFVYLSDHEFFYRYMNRDQQIVTPTISPRPYQFTAINRGHKWWRATIMADLRYSGLLDRSLWSYNTLCDTGDRYQDNPLILKNLPIAKKHLIQFINDGPYWCDGRDHHSHNDHRSINTDLYTQSYVHLVLETHFDADQSGGSFLTEKTYKCLKFGQPFVIFGPRHSLQCLRDRGYRTFDHWIDNRYDEVEDNTLRYQCARRAVYNLACQDLGKLYQQLIPDLVHNQQHFINGDGTTLEMLVNQLSTSIP